MNMRICLLEIPIANPLFEDPKSALSLLEIKQIT